MKKLTITIALLLVVAFAMPVFGASFSDVPSDHWAYSAINKLVAAGIVEGYPDGEFKGQQSMTRYEMAVMVSRALDNIADEQKEMAAGLTTGQAEDVTAIVKALMEKNTGEEFTDAQAKQVADIVDALTFELKAELKVLGAKVDTLGKDVDELKATVAALEVPEDNIEFGMDITSTFEVGNYDTDDLDSISATMELWADGDALDLDLPTNAAGDEILPNSEASLAEYIDAVKDWEDADDLPSDKRFWQEYDFNINGNLGDAEFNFNVDTITNVFTEEDTSFGYTEKDDPAFELDTALLEVAYNGYGVKIGDMDDYHISKYLTDEEDRSGIEVTKSYNDVNFKGFIIGDDDDNDNDYYGLTATKVMNFGNLTGKLFNERLGNGDYSAYAALELTDMVLTDAVTLGGEVAANKWDGVSDDGSDYYFMINADFAATDALTVTGMFETVGDDFYAEDDDLAGTDSSTTLEPGAFEDVDYDLYQLGAEYVFSANNSVNGHVNFVKPGDDNYVSAAEDKYVYYVGWDNLYGKFTNNFSVEFTQNDDFIDDHDVRVIELGTEYAWNESTTVGAALVNKNEEENNDNVINYNYLKATIDKTLADNMTWNTEAKYIVGEVGAAETDGEGNAFTTSLTVSF